MREVLEQNHWTLTNHEFARIQASGLPVRAPYTWSVLHSAGIAARTQVPRISVVEIGVAGGNGLVALEAAAAEAEVLFGIEIDVYGMDTGKGLPPPQDHRDAPFLMETGDFPMDTEALAARLERAELILGDIADTAAPFLETAPAPIAFIAFDVDYYSSTRDALNLFRAGTERLLPRVLCYFDDTIGYPWGESNGARLALSEFNSESEHRKIDLLHGMRHLIAPTESAQKWTDALYLAHLFDHPRYGDFEGTHLTQRLDLSEPG